MKKNKFQQQLTTKINRLHDNLEVVFDELESANDTLEKVRMDQHEHKTDTIEKLALYQYQLSEELVEIKRKVDDLSITYNIQLALMAGVIGIATMLLIFISRLGV